MVIHRFVACWMARSPAGHIQVFSTGAVGPKIYGKDAVTVFYRSQNSRTGAITKEDARIAVRKVKDPGKGFCSYNKHMLIKAGGNGLADNPAGIGKSRAPRAQVKGRGMAGSQPVLQHAGHRRKLHVR